MNFGKSTLVCHNGDEIRFYSPKTGEILQSHSLPKLFDFDEGSNHSKDCEVSETKFCMADDMGELFLFNFSDPKNCYEKLNSDYDRGELENDNGLREVRQLSSLFNFRGKDLMLSARIDSTLGFWDIKEKKRLHVYEIHEDSVDAVVFLGKSNLFSSASEEFIKIVDYEKQKVVHTFHDDKLTVYGLDFDGNLLVSANHGGFIVGFDLNSKEEVYNIQSRYGLTCVLYCKDRNFVISGDWNGRLFCIDLRNPNDLLYDQIIHADYINHMVQNSNNIEDSIISCSDDKTMNIVDFNKGEIIKKIPEKDDLEGIFLFEKGGNDQEMIIVDLGDRIEFIKESFLEDLSLAIEINVESKIVVALRILLL